MDTTARVRARARARARFERGERFGPKPVDERTTHCQSSKVLFGLSITSPSRTSQTCWTSVVDPAKILVARARWRVVRSASRADGATRWGSCRDARDAAGARRRAQQDECSMGTRIYVGNLPFTATQDQIRALFEADGRQVTEV